MRTEPSMRLTLIGTGIGSGRVQDANRNSHLHRSGRLVDFDRGFNTFSAPAAVYLPLDMNHPAKKRDAYTLIELLSVTAIIAAATAAFEFVNRNRGMWAGIGAAILAGLLCMGLVVLFYWWLGLRDKKRLQELREKYKGIYRVTSLPAEQGNIVRAEGAEIKIGDYGWEAMSLHKDGLLYLQGLTPDWTVVWHAGFRADQVERVAAKPCSQYEHWVPYWAKVPPPPPCPFPVIERKTFTMGLPHHGGRYWEKRVPYPNIPPADRTRRGRVA